MDEIQATASGRAESGWADIAIRLALAALVVYWSFFLLRPFIAILIWAAVLSVASTTIWRSKEELSAATRRAWR